MNTRTRRLQKIDIESLFFMLLIAVMATACDVLEADQKLSPENVSLKNTQLYISPDGPGIINLRSLVENGGVARISVSSQPKLGVLKSLGDDLVQYTLNNGIVEGKDEFLVSVLGDNNVVVNEDTVHIIITRDSTSLPCGIYAVTDYVYNVSAAVDIAVLANDTACSVPVSQLIVSIPDLVIDGVPVPKSYYGSLQVLTDGRIRYTPGPDFAGEDKFVYSVTKPANVPQQGDPELIAHGFVYIQGVADCRDSLRLNDDLFTFRYDSIPASMDSVYLAVTANDVLCTEVANDYVFSLSDFPDKGVAGYWNNGFMYSFRDSLVQGYQDKFRYKICIDGKCDEAEVIIRID